MALVKVLKGSYCGQPVNDATFTLIKGYRNGRNGGFITVDGKGHGDFPDRNIRIHCKQGDYIVDGEEEAVDTTFEVEAVPVETDEEAMARIAERFDILEEMTAAAQTGVVRGMVVSGPPGVGKSFGVEKVLEQSSLLDVVAGKAIRYDVVKGSSTAIGLYQKLFEFSDTGDVLVLDDCDTILFDETALNILKAALDSGKKRHISWMSESHVLSRAGVPDKFEFRGSVIFITNLKFDNVRATKIKDHLEAIMSRCHYLDLTMDSERDKLLRCRQVVRDSKMLKEYGFSEEEENEVIDFMEENKDKIREVSLRMCLKISDLRKLSPTRWKSLARTTCMKRAYAN